RCVNCKVLCESVSDRAKDTRVEKTQTQRTRRKTRISAAAVVATASSVSSVLSFVSLVTLAAAQPARQAVPPPTFRTGTRLIVQTVSVKDKEGRAIEGLTAKDFVVVEDGEPQTISFVEFQRLPDRRTESQSSGSPASPLRA